MNWRWLSGGALLTIVSAGVGSPPSAAGPSEFAIVARENFRDVLIERGTLDAAQLRIYGSRIAGAQAKLTAIVAEGSEVRPGDVLLRFDASPFEQGRVRELASLAQAEAEWTRAQHDLRLEHLQAAREIESAKQVRTAADRDLENTLSGAGAVAIAQLEAAQHDAEREGRRARSVADDVRALVAQEFATRAELDQAEQVESRASEQARLARMKLAAARQYERPAAVDKARAGAHAAGQAVELTMSAIRSRIAQREAAIRLAETRVSDARARVAQFDQQIARAVVTSDAYGLVAYRDLFFGSDRRKPQVGDEVFSNQPLLAVPDSAELLVQARVREWDLRRVAVGASVIITVDAYPDVRIPGRVSLIGALPQASTTDEAPTFSLIATTTSSDRRLRPGLSARLEIQSAALDDVLTVPLEAVSESPHGSIVRVKRLFGTEDVAVRILATNEHKAAVDGAVGVGDRVLLRGQE
jgi:HlyD family secretion protein